MPEAAPARQAEPTRRSQNRRRSRRLAWVVLGGGVCFGGGGTGATWGRSAPGVRVRVRRRWGLRRSLVPQSLLAANCGWPLGVEDAGEGATRRFEPIAQSRNRRNCPTWANPPFSIALVANCPGPGAISLLHDRANVGSVAVPAPAEVCSRMCPAPRRSFQPGGVRWHRRRLVKGRARGKGMGATIPRHHPRSRAS